MAQVSKEQSAASPSTSSNSLKTSTKWMSIVLPFNMAIGPIGTFVQLYILELGGSVVDVSLAVTLYNLVSIPALIIWGFITDRVYRRRLMIIGSFLSTSLILTLFFAANSTASVSLLYALLALSTSASTAPLNLLIMETEKRHHWATAFAKFSMITSAGQTIGLFFSAFCSPLLPLKYLSIPLSLLSFTSTLLAFALIKEPPITFERRMVIMNLHSFSEHLKATPYMFLKIPRTSDFKRLFRTLRYELTGYAPTLYLSIFIFYISSGLFNTSIISFLQSKNFSNLAIFAVTTVTMIAQTLSFKYAGRYVEGKTPLKAAVEGLILRSTCYGLFGISAYLASGSLLLASALILYPLAGGLAYAIYYTASNITVFQALNGHHQGASLGVYSALVGFAIVAGSFASGLISFQMGFHITFITASTLLILSATLLNKLINYMPS